MIVQMPFTQAILFGLIMFAHDVIHDLYVGHGTGKPRVDDTATGITMGTASSLAPGEQVLTTGEPVLTNTTKKN